ncbi:hypothetical protein GP486_001336 [Trichoglossum hirsutum]|uniref:Protein phosphatase n=1 Tax=Trichoglossum hirsutum TaxID=265104 RepID=A0A9P8LH18_9PEZI|nr:hypothetical protein GP486_001336 [Trichoglossum hirsutum]
MKTRLSPSPSRHTAVAAVSQQQLRALFGGVLYPAQKQVSSNSWRPCLARTICPRFGGYGTRVVPRRSQSSVVPPISSFSYRISASYSAKGKQFEPDTNVFSFNAHTRIQPTALNIEGASDKRRHRPASGEDAFFISRVGETGDVAVGIADGVGGWAESGVDPADFSHTFCDYMASAAYKFKENSQLKSLTPRELMQTGYQEIVEDDSIVAGGSTACVGVARKDGTLEVANLGDSGFVHLRSNAVHHFSSPQTHAFNTPYQLSIISAKLLAQTAAYGGTYFHDSPNDAIVSNHTLRHGDVLVFGSDGVWDNLSAHDTLRIVSQRMIEKGAWESGNSGVAVGEGLERLTDQGESSEGRHLTLQSTLAVAVAAHAKVASLNTKIDGPFAKEVHRLYPEETYHGGKVDDICVVVLLVLEDK